ncbi:MAG: tetratricopeptide repeat protein [bacterium]|nr:tetratricopeptide repeat protein [bacterium]
MKSHASMLRRILIPLALVALIWLAYANSFSCAWQFDDNRSIVQFDYAHASLGEVVRFAPQRALGFLTFWGNYQLAGYDVAWWHVVNIALHTINTLLIFTRASRATDTATRAAFATLAGACVAGLFAVHPIQTQAVTYIVQRLELLGALCLLLAVLGAIKALGSAGRVAQAAWGILALVALAAGAFSKEIIVAAPVIIAAYVILLQLRTARARWYAAAICAAGAVVCVLALLLQFKALRFTPWPHFTMAPFAVLWETASPMAHYATQARMLLLYGRVCLFPWQQRVEYDLLPSAGFGEIGVLAALALHLAVLGAGLALWRRMPAVLLGLVWFYAVLAPAAIMPNDFFEHRVYAALPGLLIALLVPLCEELTTQTAAVRRTLTLLVGGALALLLLSFVSLTHLRNEVWRTPLTLWQDAALKSPGSWRANVNYGRELLANDNLPEARTYLERAWQLNSNNFLVALNLGAWHYNAADYPRSLALLQAAQRMKPDHPLVLLYLGSVQLAAGLEHAGSNTLLRAATPAAWAALAGHYRDQGRNADALPLYERMLRQRPQDTAALMGMAETLIALQRTNEAARFLQPLQALPARVAP